MSIMKTMNEAAKERTLSILLSFASFIYMTFFYIREFLDNPPYGLISKIFIIGLYIFIILVAVIIVKVLSSFLDILIYFVTLPFCSYSKSESYTAREKGNNRNQEMLFSQHELERNKRKDLSTFTYRP